MIGVPCGRGTITAETATSIIGITKELTRRNLSYQMATVSHADVSVARNVLAAHFLESGCGTFIGIDDDVSVSEEAFQRMLAYGSNMVAAVIPHRSINLDAFEAAIVAGARGRDARAKAAPPVGPSSRATLPYNQITEVNDIGTGFYIIKVGVLKSIIEKGLARGARTQQANSDSITYGFYNNIIDDDGGYLSEDYSFCRRVRDAGYTVNAYYGPGIHHTGSMTFST